MTVFKWMSSLKARGVLAVKVTGNGAEEKFRVRGVVVGVSWHTVLFAHALAPLPIVAPEPLKIVSWGLVEKVRPMPV
jgi:hypothetical protein